MPISLSVLVAMPVAADLLAEVDERRFEVRRNGDGGSDAAPGPREAG